MLDFLKSIFFATAIQLFYIFGLYFVLGYFLSVVQSATQTKYRRLFGWYGILWTAWIGTPIHELSHMIFCVLFRHKILSVSFFKPNQKTGGLGYVNHSYESMNIISRIGNFFIGSSPLLFGSLMLIILAYIFLPNGREIFFTLGSIHPTSQNWFEAFFNAIKLLFSVDNLTNYKFWLFIYLAFCISSHMAPSPEDRSGMWGGLGHIAVAMLVINFLLLLLGLNITPTVIWMMQGGGILLALFIFSLIISTAHLLVMTVIEKLLFRK